jgi:hypothetical protein
LSAGAIAGILIGVLALLVVAVVVWRFGCRKKAESIKSEWVRA